MQIHAKTITINDDMDVFLYVTFESASGDHIGISRSYRFDSDHQCLGSVAVYHHRGEGPDQLEWGGPDRLLSVELQRWKLVAAFNSIGAKHPEGWDMVEVAFALADDKFTEMRAVLNRCFDGFPWYSERFAEPCVAPNVGPATALVFYEPRKGLRR